MCVRSSCFIRLLDNGKCNNKRHTGDSIVASLIYYHFSMFSPSLFSLYATAVCISMLFVKSLSWAVKGAFHLENTWLYCIQMDNGEEIENLYVYTLKLCALPLLLYHFSNLKKNITAPFKATPDWKKEYKYDKFWWHQLKYSQF